VGELFAEAAVKQHKRQETQGDLFRRCCSRQAAGRFFSVGSYGLYLTEKSSVNALRQTLLIVKHSLLKEPSA
jgi:hypothetical protein